MLSRCGILRAVQAKNLKGGLFTACGLRIYVYCRMASRRGAEESRVSWHVDGMPSSGWMFLRGWDVAAERRSEKGPKALGVVFAGGFLSLLA